MIAHSDVLVTAWNDDLLVGLARSLTDYGYVAYLAAWWSGKTTSALGLEPS